MNHDYTIYMGSMCDAVKKVEIWVTCAPTKADRNISWRDLKTMVSLALLLNLQSGPKYSMLKLLNNASILINDTLDSIFPPFQLKLLKIGVQNDKLNKFFTTKFGLCSFYFYFLVSIFFPCLIDIHSSGG